MFSPDLTVGAGLCIPPPLPSLLSHYHGTCVSLQEYPSLLMRMEYYLGDKYRMVHDLPVVSLLT